ncbi:MAG: hypothetical protein R3E01_15250 [Pirellulaceae bacterium]|nr:hypothetical protein [Planctomycetales bacterium]
MFQLDQSIDRWRAQMQASDLVPADALRELESHLRETYAEVRQLGLEPHEAFLVATHRLGPTHDLCEELGKVHGSQAWRRALGWMLAGFLGGKAVTALFQILTGFTTVMTASIGIPPSIVAVTTLSVFVACWLGAMVFLYTRSCPPRIMIFFSSRSSLVLCAVFVGVLLVGFLFEHAPSIFLSRSYSMAYFAEFALVRSIGAVVANTLVAAGALVFFVSLRRQRRGESRAVHTS